MNAILTGKLPEVISTLRRHRVKRAYAFGSVTRSDFKLESDIDLLVAFDLTEPIEDYAENFWSLEDELSRILKRRIDLLPEHTLKNSYFITEVNKTKIPLYE
jgi:uncharacterized protein